MIFLKDNLLLFANRLPLLRSSGVYAAAGAMMADSNVLRSAVV
jgi:hypothetical protein